MELTSETPQSSDISSKFSVIYEILSTSMGISLIFFFGMLCLLPLEAMVIIMWRSTIWTFISIGFSIMIAWFLFKLYSNQLGLIMKVADIVATIMVCILLLEFIVFSSYNQDAFLLQGAWFIRQRAHSLGPFLGAILIKSSAGLMILTKKVRNQSISDNKMNELKLKSTKMGNLLAIVAVLSIVFLYLIFKIYSRINPFTFYLLTAIFMIILTLPVIISFISTKLVSKGASIQNGKTIQKGVSSSFVDNFYRPEYINPSIVSNFYLEKMETKYNKRVEKRKKKGKKTRKSVYYSILDLFRRRNIPINKNDEKLIKSWLVSSVFLLLGGFLHILDIKVWAFFLYLEPAQFIMGIGFIKILFSLLLSAYHDKNNIKHTMRYKKEVPLILSNLERFIFVFTCAVLCYSVYYYTNPNYLFDVLPRVFLYAIVGVVIANQVLILFYSPKSRKIVKDILVGVSIILLFININNIYLDATVNGVLTRGSPYIDYFLFEYIHSDMHIILAGISLGILVVILFRNLLFNLERGYTMHNRSLFLTFSPFCFAVFIVIINYIGTAIPGQFHPYESTFVFEIVYDVIYYLLIAFIPVLLILFNYIIPFIKDTLNKRKQNRNISELERKDNDQPAAGKNESYENSNKTAHNRFESSSGNGEELKKNTKKGGSHSIDAERLISASQFKKYITVFMISSLVIISTLIFLGVPIAFNVLHKKPLLAHNLNNYYVWMAESSERIGENININVDDSSLIEYGELNLARNEYGALQLIWNPYNNDLTDVTYEISDFVHEQNPLYYIGNSNFSLRWVDHVINDIYPDPLIPFSKIDINKSRNTILWFSVYTPYNIDNGTYLGNVTFDFKINETDYHEILNFKINIWNFTIPETQHMRTSFGHCRNDFIKQSMIKHRLNCRGPGIGKAPTLSQLYSNPAYTSYLNTTSNEWTFEWSNWDLEVEDYLNTGAVALQVGTGVGIGRNPSIEDMTYKARMQDYCMKVEEHLENKGWIQYAYIYFIDEFHLFVPDEYSDVEYYERLSTVIDWIKEVAPDIKVMATVPPWDKIRDAFGGNIDIYCPASYTRENKVWEEIIDSGEEFWWYTCIAPWSPYPNFHIYNRLHEIRVLGWQTFYLNLHGYLLWAISDTLRGAYGIGFNGWADGVFYYDNDGEWYESIRLEMWVEGFEDYEYIWLLDKILDYVETKGLISNDWIQQTRNQFLEYRESVATDDYKYTDDPLYIYRARDFIGEKLHYLSNYIDIIDFAETPINWTDVSFEYDGIDL
ncbi:MAG: DUF4091 domain-containing protein [Candidatus Lokiarchaeota archaeon]|nr:DUF4091 domain-containing protein [Candidatus Lokiarchaeota archaeon]